MAVVVVVAVRQPTNLTGDIDVPENVLTYSVRSGSALSDAEWDEVSELFSSSYGFYSPKDPSGRAGRRIRLSPSYYRRAYASDTYQVAFCCDGDDLVAEAVFRVRETSRGRAAFVVQLVVDERYRRRGIASTLLHAIWGFSDFCCWGIVTSNAFTVESLESATFRRISPQAMLSNEAFVRREILSGIGFLETARWTITASETIVDSGFYTDRSSPSEATTALSKRLGALPEGAEWLAIVFREQPLDDFKAYRSLVFSSARFVSEAYSRMPQREQAWASKADADNKAVLETVSANLKPWGYAVLSVSNYEYVAGKGAGKVDLSDPVEATRRIFALPPSRSMEMTGEFFNPNFILLDDKRHVACRKEQFSAASGLPGEYLLCDRRFTADEIRFWAESCGLAVTESRFVRAGFDAEFDASTGKEILLITKKR